MEESRIYDTLFQSQEIEYNSRIHAFQDHKYERIENPTTVAHSPKFESQQPRTKTPIKNLR